MLDSLLSFLGVIFVACFVVMSSAGQPGIIQSEMYSVAWHLLTIYAETMDSIASYCCHIAVVFTSSTVQLDAI